jgi:hypothetical protein
MIPSIVKPFAPIQQNWNRALSDGRGGGGRKGEHGGSEGGDAHGA